MLNKLKAITAGFKNLYTGKKHPHQEERAKTCSSCPHAIKKELGKDLEHFGKNGMMCGKCGCYIPAKIKQDHEICELWQR